MTSPRCFRQVSTAYTGHTHWRLVESMGDALVTWFETMKTVLQLLLLTFVSAFLLVTCEKEETINPNENFIQQMEAVTDSIVQNANVPGIVALVVDNQKGINWLYTAGYADIANKTPMNGDLVFRIGSVTKTLTGTVLLQLVDEGRLSLEDKLSTYFPEFPRSDEITVAMLCNMTSGIFNFTDDEEMLNAVEENPTRVWTPREIVDFGFSHIYDFDPGTDWNYTNTNTFILGMIIEKLTGNSLQVEIENRIVKPLKLTQTGLLTTGTNLSGPHSKGYIWDEEEGNFLDVTNLIDASWLWAAGSAYSTPRELQKYAQILVEGGLLTQSLQQKRITNLEYVGPDTYYGYAMLKRGSFYGHNGALHGYTTTMYHSIEKNCTIIIYFNWLGDIHPDFLFYRFVDILFEGGK